MYILHIETSTGICSVALSKEESIVACRDRSEGMNHTAILAPVIEDIIRTEGIKPGDLTAISVSSGPGSYTGLRVGSSTAKAMAYSLGIPLISVPTLFALAKALLKKHAEAEYALPMIDARRMEVYTALYDKSGQEVWPASSVILDESNFSERLQGLDNIYSCGDGAIKAGAVDSLSGRITVDPDLICSAQHLVYPALELLERGEVRDPYDFVPYYLKPPNITQSRSKI